MLVDSRPMSLTVRARISRPYYKETYMPNRQRLLELALKGLGRCSPFLGPKNSMLKVDRCLLKMG